MRLLITFTFRKAHALQLLDTSVLQSPAREEVDLQFDDLPIGWSHAMSESESAINGSEMGNPLVNPYVSPKLDEI